MAYLFDEIKQNELFDMQKLGWLEAGTEEGTFKLSAEGQKAFNRFLISLPAKDRVLVNYMVNGNAEEDPLKHM